MMTVRLSADSSDILTFDGAVLELFTDIFETGGRRYHVAHISTIQFNTDRKGNVKLAVKFADGFFFPEVAVDQQNYPYVNALVAEVQKAMASFKR